MATLYDRVGGMPFFTALVDRFYDGVADDARLRPMYPDDLTASRAHLAGFLAQYWGGPTDYSAARGHPRLRMRHLRFTIGVPEAEAWARHMAAAVRAAGLDPADEDEMLTYFVRSAAFLVNHQR